LKVFAAAPRVARLAPATARQPGTSAIGGVGIEPLFDGAGGQLQNLLPDGLLQRLQIQLINGLATQQQINLVDEVGRQQSGERSFF
jgi:hypothetical protein